MKRKYLALSAIFLINIMACNKEKINNTSTRVGISHVTFFPVLSLAGADYDAVSVGGVYSDPGAKASAGGLDVPVVVSGTVNTATAGIYTLTYTATNADGFNASATRKVAVYATSTDAAANDYSGNYARTSNGVISTWIKLAPGVYKVINPGGAPGATLTVIAINPSGTAISIPEQAASDGSPTSSSNETYNNSTVPPRYSWKILNPGYGTSLRTFIKQ